MTSISKLMKVKPKEKEKPKLFLLKSEVLGQRDIIIGDPEENSLTKYQRLTHR